MRCGTEQYNIIQAMIEIENRNTHRHINKQQSRHLKGYLRASVRDCTFVLLQVHLGPAVSLSYSCWTTDLWRLFWRMSTGHSASLSDIKHALFQKGCLLGGVSNCPQK